MRHALIIVALACLNIGKVFANVCDLPVKTPEPELYSSEPSTVDKLKPVEMVPTFYDDGDSCPLGCKPHVVLHSSHNGTANAFLPPMSDRFKGPKKCENDKDCIVCFSKDDESCLTTKYGGTGPKRNRLDFTTSYADNNCDNEILPKQMKSICTYNKNLSKKLGNLNCIKSIENAECKPLIIEKDKVRKSDRTEFLKCKNDTNSKYNAKQTDPTKCRYIGCAYGNSKTTGEKQNWMLPGVCPDGKYRAKGGWDCCSGNLLADVSIGAYECLEFYPKQSIRTQ